jgi:tyrosyl-tRNA synthetase
MHIITDPKRIDEVLIRGVEEVIDQEHLKMKLLSGKQLRIKFGIDPTGSRIHIGHAVPLRKLRQFQDLGHTVILLIGDYTAMVGDPSGRDQTRPILSQEKIQENMKTYVEQASKVLDISKTEVRYNSEWFSQPNFSGLLMELTSFITVARILERDDFQKRLKEGSDIQMQEIMYPLLQGYDSVALHSDLELGGTDQKFNLLMGRKLQKKYNQEEQDIMTLPVLEGTDGIKKMSKSLGNFIALDDDDVDMFCKTMSIPDHLILKYFELATDVPLEKIEEYKEKMKNGENPKNIKILLAHELTRLYHGEESANRGQEYFASVFQNNQKPTEIDEIKPSISDIVTVLVEAGFVESRGEARRQIEGGGVKINDEKVASLEAQTKSGDIIQKGKRFFVKVV